MGTVDKMTLEEFQQYMAYYDENEPLRRQFQRTYLYAFGLFPAIWWWTIPTVCCG